MSRRHATLAASFAILALAGIGFLYRKESSLPKALPFSAFDAANSQTPSPAPSREPSASPNVFALPERINLAVPFTPQAPHANWDLPYQEACEEASLLMVARYRNNRQIASPEDANREILELVEFQNGYFGDYKDTTAAQTAQIASRHYGFTNTMVLYDFTADDIKKELALGNPVIVPAAGRMLPNPYFKNPGPLYHMLVIKGYTENTFITNDPGTKRGENFVYSYNDLLNAVHDWNGGDVANGKRAMIVVR